MLMLLAGHESSRAGRSTTSENSSAWTDRMEFKSSWYQPVWAEGATTALQVPKQLPVELPDSQGTEDAETVPQTPQEPQLASNEMNSLRTCPRRRKELENTLVQAHRAAPMARPIISLPPGTLLALEGVGAGLVAQDGEPLCAAPPSPAREGARLDQVDVK